MLSRQRSSSALCYSPPGSVVLGNGDVFGAPMVCACRGAGTDIGRNGAGCGGGVIRRSGRTARPTSGREPMPLAQEVPTAFWLRMHCAMAAGAAAMVRLAASARRIQVFMPVIFAARHRLPIGHPRTVRCCVARNLGGCNGAGMASADPADPAWEWADGVPGEIRTPDPLLRTQPLYPAELRGPGRPYSKPAGAMTPLVTPRRHGNEKATPALGGGGLDAARRGEAVRPQSSMKLRWKACTSGSTAYCSAVRVPVMIEASAGMPAERLTCGATRFSRVGSTSTLARK